MRSFIPLHAERHVPDSLREMREETLVQAAKSGDNTAFGELSRRHTKRLLLRVYRITRSHEDAEDVVQDAVLRAFLYLDQFQSRSTFATWLTRIAINSALMRLRKRRPIELPLKVTDKTGSTIARYEPVDYRKTPEEDVLERENEERLSKAILLLPPTLRIAFQLRQSGILSYEEIARDLGVSNAAVKSRLSRARLALRTLLL